MSDVTQFVVFRLGDQRYALPLASVEHVVRAAEVTPLPEAPAMVLGVIDVEGRVLPVLNVRRRFSFPEREVGLSDHFLIAVTTRRTLVLLVDEALNVVERSADEIEAAPELIADGGPISGIVRLEDGLALIHDLEAFLSPGESDALEEAMQPETRHAN